MIAVLFQFFYGGRIFAMPQKFFGSRKSIILILTGIFLLVLLTLTWWVISLQRVASEATVEPVLKIGYCGAEPEELCVLSFGRDLDENMVVNVFVPDRKFPAFYLKIKRAATESVYECEKDKEVPTNIYCYGDMVNLQERMEVRLFANADEHLVAAGTFTLKAILISESSQLGGMNDTATPPMEKTPSSTDVFNTPTETETPTPTLTLTPDTSYPDSSYPNSSYP